MEIQERIINLNQVKIQLLISWLSHQEISSLINSGDQELEDYILDNISRSGRRILLEELGFSEADFDKRAGVRKKLNKFYLELLAETGPTTREVRKSLIEKARDLLEEPEQEIFNSRFREKTEDISEALRREIESYLAKLDKGEGISA